MTSWAVQGRRPRAERAAARARAELRRPVFLRPRRRRRGAAGTLLLRFLRESVDKSWLVVLHDVAAVPRGAAVAHPPSSHPCRRTLHQGPPSGQALILATRARPADPHLAAGGAPADGARHCCAVVLLVNVDFNLTLSKWGDVAKLVGGLVPWSLRSGFSPVAGSFVSLDSRRSARTFLETRADPMEDLAAHSPGC